MTVAGDFINCRKRPSPSTAVAGPSKSRSKEKSATIETDTIHLSDPVVSSASSLMFSMF